MIKAVAFDNDCVISKYDMLEFISREIGKEKEGEFWENEYHKGLAGAKSEAELEAAAERGLRGKYSVVEGSSLERIKELSAKIELTDGAKECLNLLGKKGVKVIVISATLSPIARFFAETHELNVDEFITSLCDTTGKKIENATFVLTPLKKGEKLKQFLNSNGIKSEECAAVGDSVSERATFNLVGRERSIGFNCRESLKPFVGHIAAHYGDKNRNLKSVFEIISKL